jgi:hypothetical protein
VARGLEKDNIAMLLDALTPQSRQARQLPCYGSLKKYSFCNIVFLYLINKKSHKVETKFPKCSETIIKKSLKKKEKIDK